ncbi:filamentous hemagglutinin N-terminal domain-containing protein [Variovorax sp. J22G73]|uniref:beta strand repeat-containing protein n=1 Tax=unclassified Variovorax TaxID=663243 RepID=UPI002575EF26|nr:MULTISPECIES: filamentous hemagglutinin N-terminal domain-containing protein [unclassified Variovorax]MDM0007674.1 filamentous hemagglutinin N-terminal domain-containing protein [Variovorax sp. J22R203]MDM0099966.1 filamentous hemagglutinin N-terminal domain-containing protein [Variovorax sp. J22G73]
MRSHSKLPPRLRLLPLTIAALCAAAGAPVHAQLAVGALPTGWNVGSGNVSIVQNGSTLNIQQLTPQALVNFATFNVGAGALVDIRQPGAASALLARTTGGNPSQIYGQIKANGALWLINPAGIMVGQGARIDVGSFIASTLNVSDSDFLAGRLNFKAGGTAGAADAAGEVRNAGTITAASGGSIYLVAPGVTNTGTLNAPNGEVLLAAGQNVQLVDTGTPGVSVAITGAAGEVKNLGRIAAEAGRIGLAAGLVSNSGSINADSVVREGGRVFLRASGDLKTTAASDISANGTTGGNVQLYADGAARIDGRVSATGSAGRGGYVDTSGKKSLDVVNAPVVGKGGEWHIDPFDIEIVDGSLGSGTSGGIENGQSVIVSNEGGARIGANTIKAQLDDGVNVSITTGAGPGEFGAGDITVNGAIVKTGAVDSTLTLNASNNIYINAAISSSKSTLGLNLNSNLANADAKVSHAAQLNANLDLHGGVLTVSQGEGTGNGTLDIVGGTTLLNMPTSAIVADTVNVGANGTLAVNRAGSALSGALNNAGTVSVGGGTALFDHSGTHSGTFNVAAGSSASFSGGHSFNAGTVFTGTGTVEWSDSVNLGTSLSFGKGNGALVMHGLSVSTSNASVLTTQGMGHVVDSQMDLQGGATWVNNGSVDVRGDGAIIVYQAGNRFENNGTVTTSGTFDNVLVGSTAASTFFNNGTIVKSGVAAQNYFDITNTAGSTLRVDAGELLLQHSTQGGTVQVAAGAHATFYGLALNSGVVFSGTGAVTWNGAVTLLGDVDIGAAAPALSGGPLTYLQGNGHQFTTRNVVNITDNASWVLTDATTWNNLGSVNVGTAGAARGDVGPGTLELQGSGAFNNRAGAALTVSPGSQLRLAATGVVTNDAGGTVRLVSDGSDSGPVFRNPANGHLLNSGTVVKSGVGSTAAPLTNLAGGTVRIEEGELDARMGADNPNNGAIVLLPGSTLGSGDTHLYNNGSIAGSGTVALGGDATLFNNGTVAPGSADALGRIAVQGSYVQGANGVLNIRLGSDGVDLLDIDGAATLGGTLNLGTLGGFMPANGAMADFVVARGAGSGTFAQVNAPGLASASSTATLSVSYPAPGASEGTVARATAAVLPSVGVCTSNAALPGCDSVLPTLAQCVANSMLDGCSARLPSVAMCTVSPLLPGCPSPPAATLPPAPLPAPAPSADICTIAPNSALCQVLSPPTASQPVKPVQQAADEVIKTVVASQPKTDFDQVAFLDTKKSATPGGSSASGSGDDTKSDTNSDTNSAGSKTGTVNEPAKKMYCN